MIQNPLEMIKKFVAGEISATVFKDYLYASSEIEHLLNTDPNLGGNNYAWPSVYHFLLGQDLDRARGALNCQGALTDFMDRNGYQYVRTDAYEKRSNLIRNSQPKWLDAPGDWIEQHVLNRANDRVGKELQQWVKAELLQLFRYVKKPPRWLQNPAWPIRDDKPLVFLGQVDLDSYFHDCTSIYVFHDPLTNKTENVIQST